jgi:hypothetical protein
MVYSLIDRLRGARNLINVVGGGAVVDVELLADLAGIVSLIVGFIRRKTPSANTSVELNISLFWGLIALSFQRSRRQPRTRCKRTRNNKP